MIIQVYTLLSVLHGGLCVDLTYTVEEEKSKGSYLGDIAEDLNMRNDGNLITYRWLQQSPNNNSMLFHVSEETGKIYTTEVIDAEILCSHNTECFQIVDVVIQKVNTFIKLLELKVVIKDINDHQPEFPTKQFNIEFSEDDRKGTKKAVPNAIDVDVSKRNSLITYHLKNNIDELFTLSVVTRFDGTSKLSINLQKQLDRELKDFYAIQVVAKDGGYPVKQSILNVNITVTDVNDNSPIFSQNVYNITVVNQKTSVVSLSARDLDSGKNGIVFYQLNYKTSQIAKEHFAINKLTGEMSLIKEFSLGEKLVHKLYVDAMDEGNPPLSSTAMVLVNVINQQNNPPTIEVNFVLTSKKSVIAIFEDIEVGSFIAYVKVTDYDAGQNGKVSCSLDHDKFQLQRLGSRKYKITVKNPLDRETKDHHNITINCEDNGSPAMNSENTFTIQVMDINDEKPKLEKKQYMFFINENQDPNTLIGYINATDPDLGESGKLIYSLVHSTKEFFPFHISNDGLISTMISLDHELKDSYEFKVLVKDNGTYPLNNTANIFIRIKDENDNAPHFIFPKVNPYYFNFHYYPHHTKNITVLKAFDRDSRENAFLKYEITKGNQQLFTINHYTGQLTFSHVAMQKDAGSYVFEFIVRDSGIPVLSATTVFYLTLTANNKSSEKLSSIPTQNDDKINIKNVIIVTVIAVTVSVAITASISICIIRCANHTNTSHSEQMNLFKGCVHKEQDSMCFSEVANSWPDIPVTTENNQVLPKMPHFTSLRKETQLFKEELCNMHQTKTLDTIYKICTQEAKPSSEKYEKGTIAAPGYFTWKSNTISCINNKTIESEAEDKELDLLKLQYSAPPDQIDNSKVKSAEEAYSHPYDTTIAAMYFYKPFSDKSSFKRDDTGQGSFTFESRTSSLTSETSIDINNHCLSSIIRPLPPVPKNRQCPKH